MMNDHYPDMGGGGSPPTTEDGQNQEKPHNEDEGGSTALIPKSLLAGKEFKVGEEVILKIVHMYEDEVEVEYAPEKPEGEDNQTGAEQSANDELDAMASKSESY